MGIIRKAMSVSTLGVINYRNGSERVARPLHKQARAQTMAAGAQYLDATAHQAEVVALHRQAYAAEVQARALVAMAPAAGQWVADPSGRNARRYHDGAKWTGWVLNAAGEQVWDAPSASPQIATTSGPTGD